MNVEVLTGNTNEFTSCNGYIAIKKIHVNKTSWRRVMQGFDVSGFSIGKQGKSIGFEKKEKRLSVWLEPQVY